MNFTAIPIVAIAISVVISWALFAILCSIVHEAFAQIKAERGRFMKEYLSRQLKDNSNGVNWASMLYLHGSVDLLSRAANKPTSEIPSRVFAETLIEVVGSAHVVQSKAEEVMTNINYKHPSLRNFKAATMVLLPSDVVGFLKQVLNSAEMATSSDILTNSNSSINESQIYATLVQNIETWYDGLMGRLSLWYQKKTKMRLFLLGVLIAILINVDSIQLFNHFNNDPNARAAVINYYEKNVSTLTSYEDKLKANQGKDSVTNTLLLVSRQINEYTGKLDSLRKTANLPIGFEYNIFHPKSRSNSFRSILFKILGLLTSGLAASFGAPFWFDVLKKAYSIKK